MSNKINVIDFRTIDDLNNVILCNLHKIPHDIDLVVGIPRSGMLPANLVALYLNKPFTDIDSFVDGRIYNSGERGKNLDVEHIRKVLVMDDSICSGSALSRAKQKLEPVLNKYNLVFGVVYATSQGAEKVDISCEIIDTTRIFQWNVFHHHILSRSCFDIDGVLCLDPPIDDDGEQYLHYISNATPLFLPTVPIDRLITCRLEKYRKVTEDWLANHNVKYNKLIMMQYSTRKERIAHGNHGEFKGEEYKNSDDVLFVESSLAQAVTIAKISNKPVFCTETFSMVIANENTKRIRLRILRYFKSRVKGLVNRLLGRPKYESLHTIFKSDK